VRRTAAFLAVGCVAALGVLLACSADESSSGSPAGGSGGTHSTGGTGGTTGTSTAGGSGGHVPQAGSGGTPGTGGQAATGGSAGSSGGGSCQPGVGGPYDLCGAGGADAAVSVTWDGGCWYSEGGHRYQAIQFTLSAPTPVPLEGTLVFTTNCDPSQGTDNANDNGQTTPSGSWIFWFIHHPDELCTSATWWLAGHCSGCIDYSVAPDC
jgi:hypothetical protein